MDGEGPVTTLRRHLRQGIYAENLHAMAQFAIRVARDGGDPLTFYALSHLFMEIARLWDEPVPVAEANVLDAMLIPQIDAVLMAALDGETEDLARKDMSKLVSSYLDYLDRKSTMEFNT